jgi:hypothetical protein
MSYKIYKHLTSTNFRGITEKINYAKKDNKKKKTSKFRKK